MERQGGAASADTAHAASSDSAARPRASASNPFPPPPPPTGPRPAAQSAVGVRPPAAGMKPGGRGMAPPPPPPPPPPPRPLFARPAYGPQGAGWQAQATQGPQPVPMPTQRTGGPGPGWASASQASSQMSQLVPARQPVVGQGGIGAQASGSVAAGQAQGQGQAAGAQGAAGSGLMDLSSSSTGGASDPSAVALSGSTVGGLGAADVDGGSGEAGGDGSKPDGDRPEDSKKTILSLKQELEQLRTKQKQMEDSLARQRAAEQRLISKLTDVEDVLAIVETERATEKTNWEKIMSSKVQALQQELASKDDEARMIGGRYADTMLKIRHLQQDHNQQKLEHKLETDKLKAELESLQSLVKASGGSTSAVAAGGDAGAGMDDDKPPADPGLDQGHLDDRGLTQGRGPGAGAASVGRSKSPGGSTIVSVGANGRPIRSVFGSSSATGSVPGITSTQPGAGRRAASSASPSRPVGQGLTIAQAAAVAAAAIRPAKVALKPAESGAGASGVIAADGAHAGPGTQAGPGHATQSAPETQSTLSGRVGSQASSGTSQPSLLSPAFRGLLANARQQRERSGLLALLLEGHAAEIGVLTAVPLESTALGLAVIGGRAWPAPLVEDVVVVLGRRAGSGIVSMGRTRTGRAGPDATIAIAAVQGTHAFVARTLSRCLAATARDCDVFAIGVREGIVVPNLTVLAIPGGSGRRGSTGSSRSGMDLTSGSLTWSTPSKLAGRTSTDSAVAGATAGIGAGAGAGASGAAGTDADVTMANGSDVFGESQAITQTQPPVQGGAIGAGGPAGAAAGGAATAGQSESAVMSPGILAQRAALFRVPMPVLAEGGSAAAGSSIGGSTIGSSKGDTAGLSASMALALTTAQRTLKDLTSRMGLGHVQATELLEPLVQLAGLGTDMDQARLSSVTAAAGGGVGVGAAGRVSQDAMDISGASSSSGASGNTTVPVSAPPQGRTNTGAVSPSTASPSHALDPSLHCLHLSALRVLVTLFDSLTDVYTSGNSSGGSADRSRGASNSQDTPSGRSRSSRRGSGLPAGGHDDSSPSSQGRTTAVVVSLTATLRGIVDACTSSIPVLLVCAVDAAGTAATLAVSAGLPHLAAMADVQHGKQSGGSRHPDTNVPAALRDALLARDSLMERAGLQLALCRLVLAKLVGLCKGQTQAADSGHGQDATGSHGPDGRFSALAAVSTLLHDLGVTVAFCVRQLSRHVRGAVAADPARPRSAAEGMISTYGSMRRPRKMPRASNTAGSSAVNSSMMASTTGSLGGSGVCGTGLGAAGSRVLNLASSAAMAASVLMPASGPVLPEPGAVPGLLAAGRAAVGFIPEMNRLGCLVAECRRALQQRSGSAEGGSRGAQTRPTVSTSLHDPCLTAVLLSSLSSLTEALSLQLASVRQPTVDWAAVQPLVEALASTARTIDTVAGCAGARGFQLLVGAVLPATRDTVTGPGSQGSGPAAGRAAGGGGKQTTGGKAEAMDEDMDTGSGASSTRPSKSAASSHQRLPGDQRPSSGSGRIEGSAAQAKQAVAASAPGDFTALDDSSSPVSAPFVRDADLACTLPRLLTATTVVTARMAGASQAQAREQALAASTLSHEARRGHYSGDDDGALAGLSDCLLACCDTLRSVHRHAPFTRGALAVQSPGQLLSWALAATMDSSHWLGAALPPPAFNSYSQPLAISAATGPAVTCPDVAGRYLALGDAGVALDTSDAEKYLADLQSATRQLQDCVSLITGHRAPAEAAHGAGSSAAAQQPSPGGHGHGTSAGAAASVALQGVAAVNAAAQAWAPMPSIALE